MATPPPNTTDPGRQPIPPALRKRLQACFTHGSTSAAKGDFDYATKMFEMCVAGDPSNQLYIKQFLDNLNKKYKGNKKGAGFTSAPMIKIYQGKIKKSQYSKDWPGVIKDGVEILKLNPWEISTLVAMADACDALNFDEAQLAYLKQALDFDLKEPEVNRKCGRALARLGEFDQAKSCWARVVQAKPGDEEGTRAIADLAIEKTIHDGRYEGAQSSTDVMADKAMQSDRRSEATARLSPIELLEKSISKKPEDVGLYLELSDLHTNAEDFKSSITVLSKALEVAGGDIAVRERLEDAQLRDARQQLKIAEKRVVTEKTPEAEDLMKRMRQDLNSRELEIYRARSERYPTNLSLRFEMGVRLKKGGQYKEAIDCLQKALGDPKRKAQTHMEIGECFHYIKQYKLAMKNYEDALEAAGTRDLDQRKLALYRAGKLALGLAEKFSAGDDPQAKEETDRAENYLNELAGMDFGYKDVSTLLDKIAKLRNKD